MGVLSKAQAAVASSEHRFRVLVSGRRFGKTTLAVREMARVARFPRQKVWYVAPTYRMARQITWEMLKEKFNSFNWARRFDNSDLTAYLRNGSTISLRGADHPDSLRGVGLAFLVMDEVADIKPEAWFKVLRPTLSDSGGTALFCGTPKGRNWAYDLWSRGREGREQWASWQYTTLDGERVPEEEVEEAKGDLDDLTFQQEYLASFVNFEGQAYYDFSDGAHCYKLEYDKEQPLMICLDFNVSPGVAAIAQEMKLPNGEEGTGFIGEVYIPRNSNTPAVCRKILEDWGDHEGQIEIFGDSTGGTRGTAQTEGTDWDLVESVLRQKWAGRYYLDVPDNPPERTRLNAVNSRIKTASGDVRLAVDPSRCPNLVKDFEGVQLLEGGSGEIDKKHDKNLTHLTDAAGYYIHARFPILEEGKVGTLDMDYI